MDFALLLAFLLTILLICIRFSNWKGWKEYYPTILYAILWSFIYNLVYNTQPLWTFTKNDFSYC